MVDKDFTNKLLPESILQRFGPIILSSAGSHNTIATSSGETRLHNEVVKSATVTTLTFPRVLPKNPQFTELTRISTDDILARDVTIFQIEGRFSGLTWRGLEDCSYGCNDEAVEVLAADWESARGHMLECPWLTVT